MDNVVDVQRQRTAPGLQRACSFRIEYGSFPK